MYENSSLLHTKPQVFVLFSYLFRKRIMVRYCNPEIVPLLCTEHAQLEHSQKRLSNSLNIMSC